MKYKDIMNLEKSFLKENYTLLATSFEKENKQIQDLKNPYWFGERKHQS